MSNLYFQTKNSKFPNFKISEIYNLFFFGFFLHFFYLFPKKNITNDITTIMPALGVILLLERRYAATPSLNEEERRTRRSGGRGGAEKTDGAARARQASREAR